MSDVGIKDPRPLGQRVYEQVCDDIVNEVIAPGAQLVQDHLASQYGVSRMPVRDVLTRLELEGLADFIPGRGYFVKVLSDAEIVDVYEVRREIEVLAIRRFDGKYSPMDLAVLEMKLAEAAAVDELDFDEIFRTSRDFHLALVEPCPNKYLLQSLRGIWENPVQRLIIRSYKNDAEKASGVVAKHRRLLSMARAGHIDELIEHLASCHSPLTDTPRLG